MAEETTQLIIGDAAADAVGQPRKRRFFAKRKKHEKKLTTCENCGAALAGEYCSACGQHAIDYHRSIWRVAVDALDSFFNWDTKFLKTTGVLLTRPGKLTNDFNAGRRVRYVHPLRLYLLASIAFFLIAKLVNFTGFKDNRDLNLTAEDRVEIDAAVAKLTGPDSPLTPEQRARVEAARARWVEPDTFGTPQERALFQKGMLRLTRVADKKELKTKDVVRLETALGLTEGVDRKPQDPLGDNAPTPDGSAAPPSSLSPTPAAKNLGPIIQFDADDEKKPKDPFEAWLETRIKDKIGEDGTKAELFLDTLRSNVPTMMLACVPLFAFVLKVLYIRQRRYYVEHLVYALHIHTFVYVAVVVITLIGMAAQRSEPAFQPVLVFILSMVATVQVFLSIRRVYQQGWFITTSKFLLGGFVYLFVLACGVAVTAFVTLVMP
ncbi:MAG: DUF3667 domain-containing protein [Chthoniobacterales bacterium]|nr:DUF3667 domain-containing protein [Chthoniobacterales bacterium]